MAVDKNFVVKNGIEVNSNLIIADANTKKVGIGSTGPRVTLDVRGGIAATDGHFSGILTATTLDAEDYGVVNATGANITGFATFTGGVSVEQLNVTGFTTFADILLDEVNARNLNVTGIATIPTFAGLSAFENITASGVSTITDFNSTSLVSTNLNVTGVATVPTFSGLSAFDNINASGISNITSLNSTNASVSGILTATNRLLVRSDDSTPGRIDYYCEVSDAHYTRVQAAPHAEYSGNVTAILPTVSGDFIVGDTSSDISQSIRTSGNVTASAFYGDGANVTGISTFNIVNYQVGAGVGGTDIIINTSGSVTAAAFFTSGIVTASSFVSPGIITASAFSGDGSQLSGLGIGINTATGLVGYGFTHIHFRGAGVSTTNYNTNLGIATIFFEGGSGSTNVVDDTSPQLGGDLDLNGNNIIGSGDIPAANLTGTLPAIDGSSLTNISAANLTGTLPAIDGGSLTNINAANITLADESSDTTCFPVFATDATGNQAPKTDSSALTYNASTGTLSCTDFNTTSDINLKKDIEVISNANEILKQIDGVNFTWSETNKLSLGVIAQDVEKVLPQLVSERSDTGTKSVNYNGLIGVLIESVKELSQRVKELEDRQN